MPGLSLVLALTLFLGGVKTEGVPRPAQPAHEVMLDCAKSPNRSLTLTREGAVSVEVASPTPAWIVADAIGVELEFSADPDVEQHAHLTAPLRYGRAFALLRAGQHMRLKRLSISSQPGKVQLHCALDQSETNRIGWYLELGRLTERMAKPISSAVSDELVARSEDLRRGASDAGERALAAHVRAQALHQSGRSAITADAFAVAELEWLGAGDVVRAMVARIGRVENLQLIGKFAEALALATTNLPDEDPASYFSVRLANSACLSFHYQGKLAAASDCYRASLPRLRRLGETAELGSAMRDYAEVDLNLGRFEAAEQLANDALALGAVPNQEVVRGRLHLLIADLATRRGRIAEALGQYDAALAEFSAGAVPRWEANAMLLLAGLYRDLDAFDEAYRLIEAARQRYTTVDAPARIAATAVTKARTDILTGRYDNALGSITEPEDIYSKLEMKLELQIAQLVRARALLRQGKPVDAGRLLPENVEAKGLLGPDLRALRAWFAALEGNCRQVANAEPLADSDRLDLVHRVEQAEIRALCADRSGDSTGAMQILRLEGERVVRIARAVSNPLLRRVLLAQLAPLRRAATEMLKDDLESTSALEQLWWWANVDELAPSNRHASGALRGNAARFDENVARELLSKSDPAQDPARARELLSVLSASPRTVTGTGNPSALLVPRLVELVSRLQPNDLYVTSLDAGSSTVLLWVTSAGAHATLAPGREQLGPLITALIRPLSSPEGSISNAQSAALELSRALFHGDAPREAPGRLLVSADSQLSSIPWALVLLPGSPTPLLESSIISLVRFDFTTEPRSLHAPRAMQVVIAAQPHSQSAALPELRGAQAEATMIKNAVGD